MAEVGRATLVLDGDDRGLQRTVSGATRSLRGIRVLGLSVGAGVTAAAGAIATGGVLAVRAASDFESSFAGVRKTVDATETEFAQLARGMRDLALEIPVNVNELNRIGEAAGQLGIKTENILDFTETMAKLGVTTNLSADQAATALARLANITGLPQDQFDRLGSTIVSLGNNFATTEAEIVNFGLRIAGAGEIAGLTEPEILAIGAAMSSVGIEAEAGGTAVQKVLLSMTQAVEEGGDKLRTFAATAGLSASEFAEAFRTDAASAFEDFVTGLGEQGKSAFNTLAELELQDERLKRAFLSLAGASEVLTGAFGNANTAFEENTALSKEASQRFETFASQWQLFRNSVNELAIDVGNVLLPAVRRMVESFRGFVDREGERVVEWFRQGLPRAINVTLGGIVVFSRAVRGIRIAFDAMAMGLKNSWSLFVAAWAGGVSLFIKGVNAMISAQRALTRETFQEEFSFNVLQGSLASLAGEMDRVADGALRDITDRSEEFTQSTIESLDAQRKLERGVETFRRGLLSAGAAAGSSADAVRAWGSNVADVAQQTSFFAREGIKLTGSLPEMSRELGSTAQELTRFLTTTTGLTEVQVGFLRAAGNTSAEIVRYGRLLDSTDPQIRKFARSQLGLNEELDESVGALGSLGESLQAIGQGLGFIDAEGGFDLGGGFKELGKGVIEGFGQLLSGGITSAINAGISALIGVLSRLFGSDAKDFANEIQGNLGPLGRISDDLAQRFGELANELKDTGEGVAFVRAQAQLMGDILQETGIRTSDAFFRATDITQGFFDNFAEGAITIDDLRAGVEGALPVIIDNLEQMDERGRQALRNLIENAREAGESFEQLDGLVRGAASGIADGVSMMLDAGIQGPGQAVFAAQGLTTAFQELIAQGIPAAEAFAIIGEQARELQSQADALGVTLPEPFMQLSGIMDVLADDKIAKLQQRIDGMGQVMQSLLEVGIKPTAEQFGAFEGNANRAFQQLRDQGLSAQDAFLAMADDFKLLARLQNDFGIEVSDATKKIFEEAGATDLLESEGLDTQDVLIQGFEGLFDRLDELIRTFGGSVSDEFGRMRDDAGIAAAGIADHFRPFEDGLQIPVNITPRISGPVAAGGSLTGEIPSFHNGGTVPGPVGRERLVLALGGETFTPPGRAGGQAANADIVSAIESLESTINTVLPAAVKHAAETGR